MTAAWFEWRTSIASTVPDENGVPVASPAVDDFEVRPPPWFVRQELGFAFEHGPSLMWTCESLDGANRRAVVQLGREAPDRVTYPRDFHDPRRIKPRGPRARQSLPPRATAGEARRPQSFDELVAEFWKRHAA